MTRTYSRTACNVCGDSVSTAGFPHTSHMRRHVREGYLVETTDSFGYRIFDRTGKNPPSPLTESQIKALTIIRDMRPISSGLFAELMWPDSTMHRKHSKSGRGTQIGKAAWLAGGSYLGRLRKNGLVVVRYTWERPAGKPVASLTRRAHILLRNALINQK